MPTREHLIYNLQDLYAFERDLLPLLAEMQYMISDKRLQQLLQGEREGLRGEMETLERGLNLLGARYRQERNAVVPGLREAFERFRHQMNPTREQVELHAVLTISKIAPMIQGAYRGAMEMARAVGESDVAMLLEENAARQQQGLDAAQRLLPQLVVEVSRSEIRRAA